jgi:hypothetical protein
MLGTGGGLKYPHNQKKEREPTQMVDHFFEKLIQGNP